MRSSEAANCFATQSGIQVMAGNAEWFVPVTFLRSKKANQYSTLSTVRWTQREFTGAGELFVPSLSTISGQACGTSNWRCHSWEETSRLQISSMVRNTFGSEYTGNPSSSAMNSPKTHISSHYNEWGLLSIVNLAISQITWGTGCWASPWRVTLIACIEVRGPNTGS